MPTDFSQLNPQQQNVPTSTVSQPTTSPLDADAQKKLQGTIDKFGYAPRTQEEQDMFYRATFSGDELKKYGLDQSYQTLKQQADLSRQSLSATPPPTNSGLRVLQEALNTKSNVTDQQIGTSELFKSAGLSGYAVLRQSMEQRQREMDQKYNSFKNTVTDTAGGMVDTYNLVLNRYQLLRDELDTQDQKMQTMLDDALDYERAMDKLAQQQKYELEMQQFKSDIDSKNVITTPDNANVANLTTGEKVSSQELTDLFGLGEPKGWCGVWASQISTASKVGDSWTQKKSHIDKTSNPSAGDKLLIPLGVTDGKGYGHVATVIGYDPKSGDILVVESNRDGRQNKNPNNPGVATIGVYNTSQLKQTFGNNWGFASGELKPQYKQAEVYADKILSLKGGAALQFPEQYKDLKAEYNKQLEEMPVVGGWFKAVNKQNAEEPGQKWSNDGERFRQLAMDAVKALKEKQGLTASQSKKIEEIMDYVNSKEGYNSAAKTALMNQLLKEAGLDTSTKKSSSSSSGGGLFDI